MNMKSQYRAELKTLDRANRKLNKDQAVHARSVAKQIDALNRSLKRGERATERERLRIGYRRAILQGRLDA